MKNVTMIAAVGKNLELGKDNHLLWHLKGDLKFFREQTMGKPIVMGRKTLESLPRLLPGRKHIVLTRQCSEFPDGILVVHSKEELLDYIQSYQQEVMIIGGASLYHEMLEDAEKLVLTEVDAEDTTADVYFPAFDKSEWNSTLLGGNREEDISYKHLVYTRKSTKNL